MMTLLARLRILPKILAVIILLSAITIGVSWIGVHALSALNEDADTMRSAAGRALAAARAGQDIIALSRAEYQISSDPSIETRAAVRKVIDERMKSYQDRLELISQTRDEKAKSLVPGVSAAMAEYKQSMETTLRLAEGAKEVTLSAERATMQDQVIKSRALSDQLQTKINVLADALDDRVARVTKSASDEYETSSRLMMILSAIGVMSGLVIGFVIGQFGIVTPANILKTAMEALARNDLKVDVPGVGRRDELGDMARTVEVFKVNALEVERLKTAQETAERRTAEQRKADMHKLANEFESAVGEIIQTVSSAATELEASATTLTSAASRTEQLSTSVASAAEEASANVHSVASASEEMAASVNEISQQVQESARIASSAVAQADKTNERVNTLSQAAKKIGDVVELINTIAGQTNLLALNATIEAARAGEAGRGFAVVASEVKSLAEQTARATGEIGQQISEIQTATHGSVDAIHEISATILRIAEIASAIASAVEEQGAATREISRNVQQASQGTTQVASNITDVQHASSETGSASSQVLSSARSLASESDRLKMEVGKFLTTVRAA
jgi:methyl-accepting chemotaxis protein